MRKYGRMLRKQYSENITQSTEGDVPSRPQSPDELAQWFGCSRRFIEGEVALILGLKGGYRNDWSRQNCV